MTKLTEEQITSRHTLGRMLFISGIVCLLLGLYVSVFMIPDMIRTMSGPQSVTLEEASQIASAERTYVSIVDGRWHCDTLSYVEGFSTIHLRHGTLEEEIKLTEIFYTSDAQDIVVYVTLSGELDCDDIAGQSPSGDLFTMYADTRQELTNDARLVRYIEADTFLELCGFCGQDNSLIGAIFGIIFVLSGMGLIVFGRNLKNTSNG